MLTCLQENQSVFLSRSASASRKTQFTFEMIFNGKCWIGINTLLANKIVSDAITKNEIPELLGYDSLQTEIKYGKNSRIDILLNNSSETCYVEIKNVTYLENGDYLFPNAVTLRGQKHLQELISMKKQGNRAVQFFLIQRSDGRRFRPAEHIDKMYAEKLRLAAQEGVELIAYEAIVTPEKIEISKSVEIFLS
jgi:sugar fermentation stimulation protein A